MANSIETRIALRGDIKDVMNKMNAYKSGVSNINKKVNKSFKNTNAVVGKLGGLLAGLGVGMGFKKIIDVSGEFENSMARVKAITQATGKDFDTLRETAKHLGATTQFSASQAAEGLQYLGMAGYNTEQSITALPHTLNLAAAGAIDLGQAADIASNVVAGMGYDISETERVIDVLAHTSRTANTDVTEMGEAAKKAAPVFSGLGLEIEELAVSTAIMANNGIKGADAGTAMTGALSRLLKQPKMVSEALAELGVTITEQSLKTDGFIGTLQKLSAAGINNTQMAAIFGDHWKSIGTIINTSSADINALTQKINNSKGAAADMAENGVGAWQKGMGQLNSALEGLMINLGEGGLLGTITKFVNNLTSFISYIGQLTGSFESAIPVLYAFATAATAAWAALTGGISAIVTAVAVAVTGVITYWNEIILAIENSINAVIDFINSIDIIRTTFVAVIEYVKFFFEFMKTYLGFLVEYFTTIGKTIFEIFKIIFEEIKKPVIDFYNTVIDFGKVAFEFFKGVWVDIKAFFTKAYEYISDIIDGIGDFFGIVKDEATELLDGLGEDSAWRKVGEAVGNSIGTITDKATEGAKHLEDKLNAAVKNVADTWNGKEIAHVKLGLTTASAAPKKDEKTGDVGKSAKSLKGLEDITLTPDELEEIPEELEIIDSVVVNVNESLSSLGESFTTVFGGASNSLGSFVGKALSSLPKLMGSLEKLGIIQKKEAIKQVAGDQAKSISGGTASAAKLPFPANIAAIAAVIATITSVFASLPKFETGGVVGGSSYYGDKILARVNSGELILNRQQQADMYNQFGSSSSNGSQTVYLVAQEGELQAAFEYSEMKKRRM